MVEDGQGTPTQLVTRHMLDDLDILMSDITKRVWSQVQAYADVLVDQIELGQRVRENLEIVLTAVSEDRPLTDDEIGQSRENGERRALQGVTQSAVIRSFRNAERAMSQLFLAWCVKLDVPPSKAAAGQAHVIDVLDELENAMLTSYAAMREQIDTASAVSEPDLIRRLVLGEAIAAQEVAQLAQVMRLPDARTTPFVGAAVTLPGLFKEHDPRPLVVLRHQFVARLQQATGQPTLSSTVIGESGLHTAVFMVPWSGNNDDLRHLMSSIIGSSRKDRVILGAVGTPYAGMAQAGQSCREALAALVVGVRQGLENTALSFDDVLLQVLVMREPGLVRTIHQHTLGRLDGQDFLRDTLRALLESTQSASAAAKELHVHKNTVVYRMRRIEDLTGLSMSNAADLAHIILALQGENLGVIRPTTEN